MMGTGRIVCAQCGESGLSRTARYCSQCGDQLRTPEPFETPTEEVSADE